jgi:hypothetical protein
MEKKRKQEEKRQRKAQRKATEDAEVIASAAEGEDGQQPVAKPKPEVSDAIKAINERLAKMNAGRR